MFGLASAARAVVGAWGLGNWRLAGRQALMRPASGGAEPSRAAGCSQGGGCRRPSAPALPALHTWIAWKQRERAQEHQLTDSMSGAACAAALPACSAPRVARANAPGRKQQQQLVGRAQPQRAVPQKSQAQRGACRPARAAGRLQVVAMAAETATKSVSGTMAELKKQGK